MTTDAASQTMCSDDEMHEALLHAGDQQRYEFAARFGRAPTEDDPWFFDPDATTPQPYARDAVRQGTADICQYLDDLATEAEFAAELMKAIVYACRKTGFVFDQRSYRRAPEADRWEYDAAVQEYFDHSTSGMIYCVPSCS